jgi:beta-galactosidase
MYAHVRRFGGIGIILLGMLVFALPCLADTTPSLRRTVSLNGAWEMVYTDLSVQTPPEAGWKQDGIPRWIIDERPAENNYVWLRRSIEVPADWTGKRVFVKLWAVRYAPQVYLDGVLVGGHKTGCMPFEVELTGKAMPGKQYTLAIRCQDLSGACSSLPELGSNGTMDYARKIVVPFGGWRDWFGCLDDLELIARPANYLDRIVVAPSWRNHTLTLQGKIDTGGNAAVPGGLCVSADVRTTEGAVAWKSAPVEVQPSGEWEITEPFPKAHPWSPEDPFLYNLNISLLPRSDSAAADEYTQKMGFKECWAEGPDFYFNGVKRHFLASSTWPSAQMLTREEIRAELLHIKAANVTVFRFHTMPWTRVWVEVADEIGMITISEGSFYTPSNDDYDLHGSELWKNYEEMLERLVWRDRNHASLVMWSIENEVMFMNGGSDASDIEAKLSVLGKSVKALDPYHLITFEADIDPKGVADVIGLHYPHEMPGHYAFPNTADWLGEQILTDAGGGMQGERRVQFQWDRKKPLYIGEYLWVPINDYSLGSIYYGEDTYLDRDLYYDLTKNLAWFYQTVAYRRAGVSGLCPWTAIGHGNGGSPTLYQTTKDVFVPVAAFPRKFDDRFFAGDTVERTYSVFNDSPDPMDLKLAWEFGTLTGECALHLQPGGYSDAKFSFVAPQSIEATKIPLRTKLLSGGKVLHEYEMSCAVVPRKPLRTPDGVRLLVLDPKGEWAPIFKQEGLVAKSIASLDALKSVDPARDVLIIAPGAWAQVATSDTPTSGTIIGQSREAILPFDTFLEKGGRCLYLEQEDLTGFPGDLELIQRDSTYAFTLGEGQPLFRGMTNEDLRLWGGDHYVTKKEFRRPAKNGTQALMVTGGEQSLDQAPVVEMAYGKGTAVLIEMLVGEKFRTVPGARTMLQNAIDWVAGMQPQESCNLAISGDPAFLKALSDLGVRFATPKDTVPTDEEIDRARLLIMDGGGKPVVKSRKAIERYLAKADASPLYWHSPTPKAYVKLRDLFGASDTEIQSAQAAPELTGPRNHSLLKGISREDVRFMTITGYQYDMSIDENMLDGILASNSTTETFDRLEAEKMECRGGYVVVPPGERKVLFASSGQIDGSIDIAEPGMHLLKLTASGTVCQGVYPIAEIRVGGMAVATINIDTDKEKTYMVTAAFKAGPNPISIAFTNDAQVGKEDRNLTVDVLEVSHAVWKPGSAEVLVSPAALSVFTQGKHSVAIDGIRWDEPGGNAVRAGRYATNLLANLGAYHTLQPAPKDRIPSTALDPVGDVPYFGKEADRSMFFSGGSVAMDFQCGAAGTYDISVLGSSTPMEKVFGIARIAIDDKVVGEAELASENDQSYDVGTMELSEGRHHLVLTFTNDDSNKGEDRNLRFSAIDFQRASE